MRSRLFPRPDTPFQKPYSGWGEIVNVGAPMIGVPGVGARTITRDQTWTFERPSLTRP